MPVDPPHPAAPEADPPSWLQPVIPVIPEHRLVRRIGGGSYGDVWLAQTTVGGWRAVKVVFRDRFTDSRPYEREFRGIQRFEPLSRSNEAFVDVLQIGRNEQVGYFYYIMELADDASVGPSGRSGEGQGSAGSSELAPATYIPKTLSQVLAERGRLPVTECLELGLTLNLGLARLHAAGLIHRDIKPSNIIFVGGVPKLADIGLVIEMAEARSYVGTEGYIPPEGPNSAAADLYSLGKVLYEAGMGKDRKDFPEPCTQIENAPDSANLLEFNAILLKACAANVEERYRSAEEMNADLALLRSGGSVRRQRRLVGQLRRVQRAGALVTAVAAIVAAGWWWQARQTGLVRELMAKTTALAAENRDRLESLSIANGIRLLDQNDAPGALLWFSQALTLATNRPAREDIHRFRIQQTLDQIISPIRVWGDDSGLRTGAFSPDGRQVAIGSAKGSVRVCDIETGATRWERSGLGNSVGTLRFTRDGSRVVVSRWSDQGAAVITPAPPHFVAVLDAQTGKECFPISAVLPGLATNLEYAAFSPDGEWLAAARADRRILLIATRDGRLVTELPGHPDAVQALAFSPDGTVLASAGKDATARLWRVPSGESGGPGLEHAAPVRRIAFSADGKLLATATDPLPGLTDCLVQVWDLATGGPVGLPIRSRRYVYLLDFERKRGQQVLTCDNTFVTAFWDIRTHEQPFSPVTPGGGSRCWDFSPDGERLALGGDDGTVVVFDPTSGTPALAPLPHNGFVDSVDFSPDGSFLLTTSDDGTARVWAIKKPTLVKALRLETDILFYFGEGWGRRPGPLQVPLKDGSYSLVDPTSLSEVHRLHPLQTNGGPYDLVAAPDGAAWVMFGGDQPSPGEQRVALWRTESLGLVRMELPHPKVVWEAVFTADSRRLVTFGADACVRWWRTSDGSLEERFLMPGGGDGAVELLADGRCAVVLRSNRWEVVDFVAQTTRMVMNSTNLPTEIERMTWAPDGSKVGVVGGQHGVVYDLVAGRGTPPLKHGQKIIGLDLSPDGRHFLTAGLSAEARVWDSAKGMAAYPPIRIGKKAMRFACWSTDGRFIVCRSDEQVARVFDAATGEAVSPLLRHSSFLRFAAMTRGNRLISVSDPDLLQAWDLRPCRLSSELIRDYASLVSGRKLDPSGGSLPVPPSELEAQCQRLREVAPALFP